MADDSTTSSIGLGRRIITGLNDATGKAQILYDDSKGHVSKSSNGNLVQTMWWTDAVPVDCSAATNQDPTSGPKPFQITNEGSVCTLAWVTPGIRVAMHKTKSIDYLILLEGELELELDGGDKRLIKPGDVAVQRETNHTWYNPHPTQCAKAFVVMVASKNAIASEEAK